MVSWPLRAAMKLRDNAEYSSDVDDHTKSSRSDDLRLTDSELEALAASALPRQGSARRRTSQASGRSVGRARADELAVEGGRPTWQAVTLAPLARAKAMGGVDTVVMNLVVHEAKRPPRSTRLADHDVFDAGDGDDVTEGGGSVDTRSAGPLTAQQLGDVDAG